MGKNNAPEPPPDKPMQPTADTMVLNFLLQGCALVIGGVRRVSQVKAVNDGYEKSYLWGRSANG
jgi:hypothetical protein